MVNCYGNNPRTDVMYVYLSTEVGLRVVQKMHNELHRFQMSLIIMV